MVTSSPASELVGEAGVAELVQGVAPGGGLPDLLGPPIRQPCLTADWVQVGGCRGQVGPGFAVTNEQWASGAAVDQAG